MKTPKDWLSTLSEPEGVCFDGMERWVEEVQRDAISTTNQFEQGVHSMARSCLSALELVKNGVWVAGDVEKWLQAVITQDKEYCRMTSDRMLIRFKSTNDK